MHDFQKPLVAAWTDYAAGRIDAKALKAVSAGFGIYQQRDGRTMMRVRRVAGRVTARDLQSAARILRAHGGTHLHLTTRQDFQLHGLPAGQIPAALAACEAAGFPFRGGGGDTFRNVRTSAFSGLHGDSVFDVAPYAQALSRAFAAFDRAYALPRKLKIAFADRPADRVLAQANDLGFCAARDGGAPAFEVYLGGGIGFRPRLGFRLFDALPATDCVRLAQALAVLFDARGCRTNRAHARIRFLREDLGDAAFAALLKDAFARTPAAPLALPPADPPPATAFPAGAAPGAEFDAWRALATTPLAGGRAAVRLFVPFGNFTADEIDAFVAALSPFGATRFEILPTLDLGLVVPDDQLAGLHAVLASLGRDYAAHSFVGNVRTCVGCTVCTSGVTDAPAVGQAVARHFDAALRPLDTPEKIALARALLNDVRISGCPNSCTNHPLAAFGFAGRRLDGADAETAFTPGAAAPARLGAPDPDVPPIPAAAFPAFLEQRLRAALAHPNGDAAPRPTM